MYKLTDTDNNNLAKTIRSGKTRDNGYKAIDDFAKSKGVFDPKKESSFVLDFSGDKVFNAMRWVS